MTGSAVEATAASRWLTPSTVLSLASMILMVIGWWGVFSAQSAIAESNQRVGERLAVAEVKIGSNERRIDRIEGAVFDGGER